MSHHVLDRPIKIANYKPQYLHLAGAPSTIDASVDGSSTPQEFIFDPTASQVFAVFRLMIFGLGSSVVADNTYVNLSVLTNGIGITLENTGGVVTDICDGLPIKDNNGWNALAYDSRQNVYSANPKSVNARYSFFKEAGGQPVLIDGAKGEKIVITVNDDLSTLSAHYFRVGAVQLQ